MVFSCVASRNKRGMLAIRRIARAGCLPSGGPQRSQAHCEHSRASDPPKVSALSPHKAVKFDFSPFLSISGCALRGWAEGPARRSGDPAGRKNSAQACRVRLQPIAIRRSTHNSNLLISTCRSSQFKRVEACGAHSNVSCGPPLREASARATLKGRKNSATSTAQIG